jgi:uncharacterized membrane protein YkvA (DUF1232 family)
MKGKVAKEKKEVTNGLLQASDFRSYLLEQAAIMAPADVDAALSEAEEARRRVTDDAGHHPLLERQVEMTLCLLDDHVGERCPQIPFQTVALLTAALFYLLNPNDVIPDIIPRVGTSDDALVFELAFELAAAGIERYCAANGLTTDGLFVKRA